MKDPDVLALFSVMGFSFSGAAPNTGHHVRAAEAVRPAQGTERTRFRRSSAGSAARSFSLPGAIVVAFTPPSIPGLSRFGGFEFQVLDQTGTDINTPGAGDAGARRRARQPVAAAARLVQRRSRPTIRSCR